MRHLALFALLAGALLGQNPQSAVYPSGTAADTDLFVATNSASTTLNTTMNNSVTSVVLTSGTKFVAPVIVKIESEFLSCTTLTTNTLSGCTRATQGSSAASHTSGVAVYGFMTALHHNQAAAEIKAIETYAAKKTIVQNGSYLYCADTASSGTTYTCALTPTLTAYTTGMVIIFKPATASSGAATLNIDSLGAKSIKWNNVSATAISNDDLLAGGFYTLLYDGTNLLKMDGPDGAWTNVTFANSWVDSGLGSPWNTGMFRKDRTGQVCMRGLIKPGTTSGGTTILTLPAGYRPPFQDYYGGMNSAANSFKRIDLHTDGTLQYQTGGAIDFVDLAATVPCFSILP